MQANFLRKLRVPTANAWWGVGRVATLPIRPDDVSAAFAWDPVALRWIEERVSGSPIACPAVRALNHVPLHFQANIGD